MKYVEKDGDIVKWASAEERARFCKANDRELTLAKPLYEKLFEKLFKATYLPNNNYDWQRENGADGVLTGEEGELLIETKMKPFRKWSGDIWLVTSWFKKAFNQPAAYICFISWGYQETEHFTFCDYKQLQQRYRDTNGWGMSGVQLSWKSESLLINVPYRLIQAIAVRGTYNKRSGEITIEPLEPEE
jgi:hypothetical protein